MRELSKTVPALPTPHPDSKPSPGQVQSTIKNVRGQPLSINKEGLAANPVVIDGSKPKALSAETAATGDSEDLDRRKRILKQIRLSKRYAAFTDEQLLHITDPATIKQMSHLSQKERADALMKDPLFSGMKIGQPLMCCIYKTFECDPLPPGRIKSVPKKTAIKSLSQEQSQSLPQPLEAPNNHKLDTYWDKNKVDGKLTKRSQEAGVPNKLRVPRNEHCHLQDSETE